METYAANDENDELEIDSETADSLWEPEQLKRKYDKTADDDDNMTQK